MKAARPLNRRLTGTKMSKSTQANAATARQVAASIKPLRGRFTALVDKLDAAGDSAVPADIARELSDLAAALRQAVEPTPPSATSSEKRDGPQPSDGWPRDMAAGGASELTWGRDPERLRHG